MQEQELFQRYEIKNWDFSPRIYKILAASAIFNILALLVVAQTNLLTTKGCDSPLVGGVCQVLDTLVVGGKVLTTDTAMVDKDYEKTELENAEIIWIDQTGTEDFKYPAGYFSLSNPELMTPQEIQGDGTFPDIPGVPNPTTGGGKNLMETPQVLPPQNDNPIIGKMPDSLISMDNDPTRPRKPIKTPKNQKNPTLNNDSPKTLDDLGDKTANANTDPNKTVKNPTETVEGIVTNKKPLKDLKAFTNDLRSKNQVNLSSPFSVQAKGKLNKDGKLDAKTFKFLQAQSTDQNMVVVVKKSIEALNDSGYLQYLTNLSGKDLEFNFQQDGTALSAVVSSELESDTRAKSISSALNVAITFYKNKKEKAIAAMQAENNPEKAQDLQNEIDDLELLKNAKVSPDGKKIVIAFVVPQDVVTKMIERKLNEPDKPEVKPQSTAQVKENNQTSAK